MYRRNVEAKTLFDEKGRNRLISKLLTHISIFSYFIFMVAISMSASSSVFRRLVLNSTWEREGEMESVGGGG